MSINVHNVRERIIPICLKEKILKPVNSTQSKDCKLCSLPKEEHISEFSFGGILIGCKFENNLFKNNLIYIKRLFEKWI